MRRSSWKGTKQLEHWLAKLKDSVFEVEPGTNLTIPPEDMRRFLQYIDERETGFRKAFARLRTRDEALAYCEGLKLEVGMTTTKLEGWTDSPKALTAAVTNIAKLVCELKSVSLVKDPQRRCVWLKDNSLHVSARNLDGAMPALYRPDFVWEIKEYWGGGEGEVLSKFVDERSQPVARLRRRSQEPMPKIPPPHRVIVIIEGSGIAETNGLPPEVPPGPLVTRS